jgi:hypothetical protein
MAYASPHKIADKRKFAKCSTKREKILCIINSGKPHSIFMIHNETHEVSVAAAIGGFDVYFDNSLTTYDNPEKAKEAAQQIYNQLLEDLKTAE